MKQNNLWLKDPEMAEVKLSYRHTGRIKEKPILNSPDEAYSYLLEIWDLDRIEIQEEFLMLLFDKALRCIGWYKLSSGGKNATIVEVSHLIIAAALGNASSIIIAHNHPSGTMSPSKSDISLTRRISKALSTVGISLNDHLIISRSEYISLNERGLLNNTSRL